MEERKVIDQMKHNSPIYEKELCDDCRAKILREMQKIQARGKLAAMVKGIGLAHKMQKIICHACRIKIANKVRQQGGVFKQ